MEGRVEGLECLEEQFGCLLVVVLEDFLNDRLQSREVAHDEAFQCLAFFTGVVFVRLGHLSEEVD